MLSDAFSTLLVLPRHHRTSGSRDWSDSDDGSSGDDDASDVSWGRWDGGLVGWCWVGGMVGQLGLFTHIGFDWERPDWDGWERVVGNV